MIQKILWIALVYIGYFLNIVAFAIVPKEELIFTALGENAEYIVIYRTDDNTNYKIYPGIGCFNALFDDLSKDTKIYASKLTDLIAPYDNGDIGLLYIETPYHDVSCKIIDIKIH